LLHFPGINIPEYVFYPYILFDKTKTYFANGLVNLQFDGESDDNGYVHLRLGVKKGTYGYVAYIVGTEGTFCPFEYQMFFPNADKIQIVQQPTPNTRDTPFMAGNFIPGEFIVRVTDSDGNPVPGYSIVYAIDDVIIDETVQDSSI
jgi:hypothetical protein